MTITTTPTNLIEGAEDGATWLVQNLGTDDVFLARSEADCTPSNGIRIAANEAISLGPVRAWTGGDGLWVVCDTGNSADVRILRVG